MAVPVLESGIRADVESLRSVLGDQFFGHKVDRDSQYVWIHRDSIVKALEHLKANEEFQYDYFVECVGVDYSTWPHARDLAERFEVVYNVYTTKHFDRLFLKIGVNDGDSVPTAKHVFLGAEYPEREINDLLGIHFAGNEHPGRFLLPDDWTGYPLRKEYPLGGEDVLFDGGDRGPAIEDRMVPHAGESFEGRTGSEGVSGR